MSDKKITVSCSYSQKVNLGNYETADIWHSESRDLDPEASQEVVDRMRAHIFENVKRTVIEQVKKLKQ